MGNHFKINADLLLIESVMGEQETLKRLDLARANAQMDKANANRARFNRLSSEEQLFVLQLFQERQNEKRVSFSAKAYRTLVLLTQIPLLEVLWALLSIILPIMVLLQKRQARTFVCILPLLAIGFSLNNQWNGLDPLTSSDRGLFPKESSLLQSPQESLEQAWKRYLMLNWAIDKSASEEEQIEEGEFFFNLERLKRLTPSLSLPFWEKKSPLVLGGYILWNALFALCVFRESSGRKEGQFQQGIQKMQQG